MRIALAAALVVATSVSAQEEPARTVITNVNVFDGVNEALVEGASVVIDGNLISAVSTGAIDTEGATLIDGGGRTLIPGLIDVHWHTSYAYAAQSTIATGDVLEVAIRGAMGSEKTLMRGFTTVRDVGGNPFATKKMIDAGVAAGAAHLPIRTTDEPDVRAFRLSFGASHTHKQRGCSRILESQLHPAHCRRRAGGYQTVPRGAAHGGVAVENRRRWGRFLSL